MSENLTPTEDELPAEERRLTWNRFLKWTGIIMGGLIALLTLSIVVFLWRSSGALERKLQALRDAGAPVSVADLVSAPIPPEENAAVYYRRARKELGAIGQELKSVRQSDNWPNGPLTQEQLQTIQRAMVAHPNLMPLVRQATNCPGFSSELNEESTFKELLGANLDELQECRSVARYLSDRCRMLIAEGHRDKAMETCILRIVIAITQIEQQGGEVTGLDDLKLPKQQTIDPFTGQPYRMKKRPDGWVVYSVGKDLQDDGGQLDEQADMGLGPVSQLPAIEPSGPR